MARPPRVIDRVPAEYKALLGPPFHLDEETIVEYTQNRERVRARDAALHQPRGLPAKKPRGRPTIFTRRQKTKAVRMKDAGETNRAIAAYLHKVDRPTRSQMQNISNRIAGFRKAIARA